MMVVSYWEQACALLNYGRLHDDLFFETSGEFFGVWERTKPTIAALKNKPKPRGADRQGQNESKKIFLDP